MGRRRRNPDLGGVESIGSNMTEVRHGQWIILFSYKTPVALLGPDGLYKTDKKWSVTTSKHISKWFGMHGLDPKGAQKVPQELIELIAKTGSRYGVFPVTTIGDPDHAEKQREAVERLTRKRKNPRHEYGDSSDYQQRIEKNVEKAQPDDFAPYESPGKFEGEPLIALRLYDMMMNGADEEIGESDGFGAYAMILNVETADGELHFIVEENNEGFFGIWKTSTDEKQIKKAWQAIEDEYEDWSERNGGDE